MIKCEICGDRYSDDCDGGFKFCDKCVEIDALVVKFLIKKLSEKQQLIDLLRREIKELKKGK